MPTAATNALFAVEQRLWEILLAWPGLVTAVSPATVPILKPGNVERFDQLAIPWPKLKNAYKPADQVTFSLDVDTSRAEPDSRAARTFTQRQDVNNVSFQWELIAADKRLNLITQAMAEWKAAMFNTDSIGGLVPAGVQLGIPQYVARWDWTFRDVSKASEPAIRTYRLTQIITVKG